MTAFGAVLCFRSQALFLDVMVLKADQALLWLGRYTVLLHAIYGDAGETLDARSYILCCWDTPSGGIFGASGTCSARGTRARTGRRWEPTISSRRGRGGALGKRRRQRPPRPRRMLPGNSHPFFVRAPSPRAENVSRVSYGCFSVWCLANSSVP